MRWDFGSGMVAARNAGMRQGEGTGLMDISARSLPPQLYLYYGEFWREL